jgi:hypothetical protein
MAKLVWEMVDGDPSYRKIERAKVLGGWLVRMEVGSSGGGITFVPDPNHEWGNSPTPDNSDVLAVLIQE